MAGGIYLRGNIWWAWWTEPVKEPGTGRVRQRKRYASSKSGRRADAVTLLSTKIHEARLRKPRPDLPDPTYDEVRDLWLEHRAADCKAKGTAPPKLKNGDLYFQGRRYLDEAFSGWQAKNIDASDLERLRGRLAEAGLGNGANHVFRSLRAMLRWAVECGRSSAGG